MPWTAPADTVILAVHAALLPGPDRMGEIVYFGGDQHNPEFVRGKRFVDATRRMSCVTLQPEYVASPEYDLFCCGHSLLADGRLLFAGGTVYFPDNIPIPDLHKHGEGGHFPGHRFAGFYSSRSGKMANAALMRPDPDQAGDQEETGGRWYPTLVTLPNGEVLAMGGHPALDDRRHNNNLPERYNPADDSWTIIGPFGGAGAEPDLYPRLHLVPSGEVFCSSLITGRFFCFAYDPFTGASRDVCDYPAADYQTLFRYPSVLLPLLPEEGYRPRILLCGAVVPQRLDLDRPDGAVPTWVTAGQRQDLDGKLIATMKRQHCLAVTLPTGEILVVGGIDRDDDTINDDQFAVREPEIYDPGIDWGTGVYRDGAGSWRTLDDPAAVTRNYHSVALLMPDGRVWTAGSSRGGGRGDPAEWARLNYEIFTPPYPAGARPRLTAAPQTISYGQSFDVRSNEAGAIRRVALLRCGSVTHAFDSDQRYVGVEFQVTGADSMTCTAPPDGAVAPPGYYMLFIVDEEGRPCERAPFVQLELPVA